MVGKRIHRVCVQTYVQYSIREKVQRTRIPLSEAPGCRACTGRRRGKHGDELQGIVKIMIMGLLATLGEKVSSAIRR